MPAIVLQRQQWIKLYSDWVYKLGTDRGYDLGNRGKSGDTITLGNNQAFHLKADFSDDYENTQFVASDDVEQNIVDTLCNEARTKTNNGEFGSHVWYSPTLVEKRLSMSANSVMTDFFLRLGNQQRILGWRRLGPNVLLEFVEEAPSGEAEGAVRLFAPLATIKIHMQIPGPIAGDFSKNTAANNLELIAAICAFAIGRPVEIPPDFFPTNSDQVTELDEKFADTTIGTLARKSVSLDIYSRFTPHGDFASIQRLRASFITFFAAMCQERNAVANILYVIAAETLTAPVTQWRNDRLTNRFIKFFEELIPDDLDVIVGHGNFEEAFEMTRGNKSARRLRLDLLDTIYAQRSSLVHFGIQSTYTTFTDTAVYEAPRRGLLSDFVEAAILRFLESPRESLIGHPGIEAALEANRET